MTTISQSHTRLSPALKIYRAKLLTYKHQCKTFLLNYPFCLFLFQDSPCLCVQINSLSYLPFPNPFILGPITTPSWYSNTLKCKQYHPKTLVSQDALPVLKTPDSTLSLICCRPSPRIVKNFPTLNCYDGKHGRKESGR